MKSVGEVMAMGRTFQESMQKALRGLETGIDGFDEKTTDPELIETELADAGPDRILYLADALRIGMSLKKCISSPTSIRGSSPRSRI
jgi:carbamoyl-phosphate synthase large subunit